ncbi:MAG TPA: DUF1207 domain-containing protein [Pirellulaceae bacterium]|nr:DUF1207 domain-containing protein [Pirellulaceae bacterium]
MNASRMICVLILLAALGPATQVRAQTLRLPELADGAGPVYVAPPAEPLIAPQGEFLDPPGSEVVDADQFLQPGEGFQEGEAYSWQLLPQGLVYRPYLAGLKESRMYGGVDVSKNDTTFWSATVGSRFGLLRYGTTDYILPDGFEIDVEGSAQVRLDVPEDVDVRSVDFRGGVPITYGVGRHRFRTGYYHLSSHLGDEFVIKNPNFNRLNYARDVIVLGYSYYTTPNLRFYGEVGWAFYNIVGDPWEFQFGVDYAPQYRTGFRGAPFFAMNTFLKEELNYSGNVTVQFGWAWRADNGPQLLRLGVQYFNGLSSQNSFYHEYEESIGAGVWYDF